MADTERVHSPAYFDFLETWAAHCGAPKSVFTGQLEVMMSLELEFVAADMLTQIKYMVTKAGPFNRALSRLITDLDLYLTHHDCRAIGHAPARCPEVDALVGRLRRAKEMLDGS